MSRLKNFKWYFSVLIAVPLVFLSALYLSPSFATRTKGFLEGITGPPSPTEPPLYNPDKWFFQADLENYTLPQFDRAKLQKYPPHNYRGPGQSTYATFFATRDGTLQDPYFVSALQIVYRLLWDPNRKTEKWPVVVFVTPYVREELREYFAAAGAIVREVGLQTFEPVDAGVPARLQDLFSKLEMWRQTDFTRIAYMDSDAFPFTNLDAIFDLAPEQKCNRELIPVEDQPFISDVCNYVFAGWHEGGDTVNAGVMVLKPDHAMYTRLVRETGNKEGWNTGFMEQAFLSHVFSKYGAFPASSLDHEWNAGKDFREKGLDFHILHHKMWADYFDIGSWVTADYNQTWTEMLALFDSPAFAELRAEDRVHAYALFEKAEPGPPALGR